MSFLKNRTVLGVICIVLSLLICFALTPLFNRSVSQKTSIVRVIKDIRCGDQITGDMVQTVEVGGYNLPENIMKQADSVIGKYAAADLSPGDYILSSKLTDAPAADLVITALPQAPAGTTIARVDVVIRLKRT